MFISVIIPLYNKIHTIDSTLKSVLNQSYTNFEVIIIDDGSTDGSGDYVKKNFDDKRIRIIKQLNKGVSEARNNGIKAAKGEWIAFLDADDLWASNYLEMVVETINKYPNSNYILSGRKVVNVMDGSSYSFIPNKNKNRIQEINFFENPHVYTHISASILNKKFLSNNSIQFVKGHKYNEDYAFLFQAALLTKVVYIGFELVTYHGGVAGQATSLIKEQERIKDSCLCRNIVTGRWIETNKQDKLFPIFMKYEIRHIILLKLLERNFKDIELIDELLSSDVKKVLKLKIEMDLYRVSPLKYLNIARIYFSKIIWRMHGFPRIKV